VRSSTRSGGFQRGSAGFELRAFLGARLTDGLGWTAITTVVGYQLWLLTGDPLSLAWLGLVQAIPSISLALFGGHLADRRDRRSIILAASSGLTVSALLLALIATQASTLGTWWIYVPVFLAGIASGFLSPAMGAFEAQVIPLGNAARGNSWSSGMMLIGMVCGPAVGGISVAIIGIAGTYFFLASLLAIATVCIWLITAKPVPPPEAHETMRESISKGIRFVFADQRLVGSMALDLFAVLFGGVEALLPIFASEILLVGPVGLGVLRTAPSVGALLMTAATTRFPPTRRAGPLLLITVAGFGVSILVFALSTSFWLSVIALFFSGLADGLSMVIRRLTVRMFSPEQMRGRIGSVSSIFIGASNEIGAFESGVMASLFGVVPSVLIGAVVTLGVVGAVTALAPRLRTMDLGIYAMPLGVAPSTDPDALAAFE
jgi:MFS family permease